MQRGSAGGGDIEGDVAVAGNRLADGADGDLRFLNKAQDEAVARLLNYERTVAQRI